MSPLSLLAVGWPALPKSGRHTSRLSCHVRDAQPAAPEYFVMRYSGFLLGYPSCADPEPGPVEASGARVGRTAGLALELSVQLRADQDGQSPQV